ncbi:MAG: Ig-like domain-containing protein [Candidatus Sericytochromatia bacterium]
MKKTQKFSGIFLSLIIFLFSCEQLKQISEKNTPDINKSILPSNNIVYATPYKELIKEPTGIFMITKDKSLKEGDSLQIQADVKYNDNSIDKNINWTISDKNIGSIDEKTGIFKAIKEGNIYITATSNINKNIFSRIEIKVLKNTNLNPTPVPSKSQIMIPDSIIISNSPTPLPSMATTPSANQPINMNIPKTIVTGKVYTDTNKLLDGAKVSLSYILNGVSNIKNTNTLNGNYIFEEIPEGVPINIKVEGPNGYVTRIRSGITRSDLVSNTFDFGNEKENTGTDPTGLYAIQDAPEITSIKINDIPFTDSDSENTLNPLPMNPDSVRNVNLSGIDPNNVKIEVTFSEPLLFYWPSGTIVPTKKFDNKMEAQEFEFSREFATVGMSSDHKKAIITIKKLTQNSTSSEARYLLDFYNAGDKFSYIVDYAGNRPKKGKTIRFSDTKFNDFVTFSVKNDTNSFYLSSLSITKTAMPIRANYSKNIRDFNFIVNNNLNYLNRDSKNIPNANDLLFYRTNNISGNNATILGYKDTNGNFKVCYVVGIIKATDIANKNIVLYSSGGDILPNYKNIFIDYSIYKYYDENFVFLPISDFTSLNKGDILVVSVGKNIKGTYNDPANGLNNISIVPDIGNVSFSDMMDLSGNKISNNNPSFLNNVYIDDSQKVILVQ